MFLTSIAKSLPTSIVIEGGRILKATAFVPAGSPNATVSYLISGSLDDIVQ